MKHLIHDFLFGPANVQLAIAWFIPLIAAGVSVASSLLNKGGTPDQAKYNLDNYSPDSPLYDFTAALKKLQADPNVVDPYLGQQQEFRTEQMALAKNLSAQANGTGPSLAETLAAQNQQKSIASLLGVVGSQPGRGNVALSQRLAATGTGNILATSAEQAQTGKLQEMLNAQSQLGQVTAQGRAGDISAGTLAGNTQNQRQEQIRAILALAQAQQQAKANLAVSGEKERVAAAAARAAEINRAIGGAASAAGGAIAGGLTTTAPTTAALASPATAISPMQTDGITPRTETQLRTTGGAQR
jgi:hypothetical protein